MLNLSKIFSVRYIATFILVLFCIRYIPLETRSGPSMVKLAVSIVAPLFLILKSFKFNKATLLLSLYYITVLFAGLFHPDSFRSSTVLYLLSFLLVFQLYYNLIYEEHAFSLDYFILLLKRVILAYTIVLLVQQAFIIVGIKYFPLINLTQVLNRGIGANSLTGEPSVLGRMLAVMFISLLRMYEVKWGKANVTIKRIYADAKWVVLGFLWSMLTMGSGTAFVALATLSLYFMKRQYVFTIVPLVIAIYFAAPYINFEPLQRARIVAETTLTLDADVVRQADGSAAARVAPMLNLINDLDLTKSETWFGRGIDAGLADKSNRLIGEIDDYGFLAYILAQIFVFSCCIKFGGIETIMYFIGIGGGTGNIAYFWGIFMLFTTVRYFKEQYSNK